MAQDQPLPADNHVHTEWSWDAELGSMEKTCERAVEIGVPLVAFTDHADFLDWTSPGERGLDIAGYLECVEHCRWRFPELRIVTGVELGEPHLFADQVSAALHAGGFERVLGSLHSLDVDGALVYAPTAFTADTAKETMRRFLLDTLHMVEACNAFEILAHIDYPVREWPPAASPYDVDDYTEEYHAILRALAASGRVLEVNTEAPGPTAQVVRWWYDAGGSAVSFGSDAHEPRDLARSFQQAAAMVEACGFRPGASPAFWRR